jgi:hypothetical protein
MNYVCCVSCYLYNALPLTKSQDTSIGTVTGYRLDSQGLIPGSGKRFVYFPQHPDQLWGPQSLISNGSWEGGSVPGGKAAVA